MCFFAILFSILFKKRITDTLCGTKIFYKKHWDKIKNDNRGDATSTELEKKVSDSKNKETKPLDFEKSKKSSIDSDQVTKNLNQKTFYLF